MLSLIAKKLTIFELFRGISWVFFGRFTVSRNVRVIFDSVVLNEETDYLFLLFNYAVLRLGFLQDDFLWRIFHPRFKY